LTFTSVIFSVCEQPTEQGFMVVAIAFTLAALKLAKRQPILGSARNIRRQPVRYSMR
jgi:hypothetical protein